MSAKPLILSNNLFDTVVQNPSSVVVNSGADDVAGHEYWRTADNLRDYSFWTPAATNAIRSLQLTNGNPPTPIAPNMLILDRGHNLAGATITVSGSTNNFSTTTTQFTATIPTSAGGLSSYTNGCVTTDGVWWIQFVPTGPFAYWEVTFPALGAGIAPVVTGLYLGVAYRFPEYALAPAALDYRRRLQYTRNVQARAGLRIKSRPLVFGEITIKTQLEDEDYIASFDAQVSPLLYQSAYWWFCQDDTDTTKSGLLRFFTLPGDTVYDPTANPRHRDVNLQLEEVAPRVTL